MSRYQLEVVKKDLLDTAEAPRAPDLYYQCTRCDSAIPSQPDDNVGCACGNVFIDVDYHRLAVNDFSSFVVVRRVRAKGS
jgi:hypothetical protein